MLVLSPEHAAVFAKAGMDKTQVRQAVFERLQVDLARVPESNRRRYATIRRAFDVATGTSSVPYFDDPSQIIVVVGGGLGLHSLFIPGFGISTRQIEKIVPV